MFRLTYSSSSSSSSCTYLVVIIRIIFIIIIFFLGSSSSRYPTMENGGYDYCGYNNDIRTHDGYISCVGSIVKLSYPFWSMEEKELQQRQYYCGYPGLGITCNPFNGQPVINISNQSYVIQSIFLSDDRVMNPMNQITIVDSDFFKKTCPRPRVNFTTDQNFSSMASHSVIRRENINYFYLTIFFNCTSPPPSLSDDSYNVSHDIECLAYNDTMRSYGFINQRDAVERDGYLHQWTSQSDWKLLVRWNGNYCREQSVVIPVKNIDVLKGATEYLKAIGNGFSVEWNRPIECERCESSSGFCSYNETKSTYTCIQPNVTLSTAHTLHADPSMHNKFLIIGILSGFGGLALIMISLFFIYRNNQSKRLGSIAKNVEIFLESYGYRSLQRYKYKDIKKMTNSFKDKLGQGGYGSVFKGKLVDGRPVAVKVLTNDPKKKTNGEDFMNEVATIGRTNHVNIVGLLGFCSSGSKRALVYEFMINGSLEKFIYAEKKNNTITSTSSNEVHPSGLGWEKLYQIAVGIARGLEYLHRGCNTGRILHFDIKPHNILLDENFCPKISDFGLAKLCPTRESIVSMLSGGRGTIGYIAPEVYNRNFGGVSYKSDVYSYGMMVLEMVGGRKNINPFVENTSEIYFPHWIYNHLEKDHDKIESRLKFEEALDEEMAKKMIMVGLWCIQTHQGCRPTMGRVAEMLEGSIKDLQMPPNPFDNPSLHPPSTS